ncbi:MAG: 4-alpha-glucanotransferase [Clostridia bacterium BRH_c25]|nr:MAG: 4-alpha-glucanotransferase [Clostridia bacterium BRH_c25]
MKFDRESGILLHITSLPSRYGIGELGSEAYRFVDFLVRSRQKLWQILPLGPVGYGESPYQCFSAFAGNTMLISIEKLIEWRLLDQEDAGVTPDFDARGVEFDRVRVFKENLYRKAYASFKAAGTDKGYDRFSEENKYWLDQFSLFMALKEYFGGIPWNLWEKGIAFRDSGALEYYKDKLAREIEYQRFLQYMFFSQWHELKAYANKQGVKIIGDLPIFVSYDSCDAWSQRTLFELDEAGNPAKVAGVPPDYFSETGQFWGNPHYKWDEMEKDDFKWWRDRLDLMLKVVDIIRIDHFRGFERYWEIPGGEKTAQKGCWVKAPGKELFQVLKAYKGDMPIIAEDLGFITREVEELKNEFEFPGMKILQFTFGRGSEERFLPHNYEENSVVYTGTHDNDTTVGWYLKMKGTDPGAIDELKRYFGIAEELGENTMCWTLIESAFGSRANTAIIPMQDVLCLGSEARMNIPSTIGGRNWVWRLEEGLLAEELEERLARLSVLYNRNKL